MSAAGWVPATEYDFRRTDITREEVFGSRHKVQFRTEHGKLYVRDMRQQEDGGWWINAWVEVVQREIT